MSRTMLWLSVSQLVPLLMTEETMDSISLRGSSQKKRGFLFSSGRFSHVFALFTLTNFLPNLQFSTSLCERRILKLIDYGSSCIALKGKIGEHGCCCLSRNSPVTQLLSSNLKQRTQKMQMIKCVYDMSG